MIRSDVIRAEFEGLEWVLQCRNKGEFARSWESMAAFNSKAVALDYGRECERDNGHRIEYRLLELSTIQPTHAIIWESTR